MTLGQEIRLGLGLLAIYRKHADALATVKPVIADVVSLFNTVLGETAAQPVHEIVAAHLTPEERATFDRATDGTSG